MVLLCSVDAGEGMNHPRAPDDEENPRPPSEVPVCGGGVRCGLFVAETDEPDPRGDERFGDFDDGDADDAKDEGGL